MAGIYIHIPFCKQACYYCNFHFSTSLKRKTELIQAIATELILRKEEVNETIETIYFGGGTPSLLNQYEIELILKTIYDNYNVILLPEITLEANPDDLNTKKLQALKKTGINRLSIGIQSFFDDDLKALNRAHTAKEAIETLIEANKLFDNITVDLIYGIPNMTNEKWLKNLEIVFGLGIKHISSYALTIEPKTALHQFIKKNKYPNVDENSALKHFKLLQQKTKEKGYIQYEVSNFGKVNYFSKHNTSYWLGKNYLGVGPAAHSFDGKHRSWNIANNHKYIKSLQENQLANKKELLTKQDIFNETIMIGLRTIWGVSLKEIENKFGRSYLSNLLHNSNKHIVNKNITIENIFLKATPKGLFFIDGVASDLFEV